MRTPTVTVLPAPSITETLDPERRTPPTLMLHPSSDRFDSAQFAREFLAILKSHSFHVVTYRDLTTDPGLSAREANHLAILTIDDIVLESPVLPSILAIVQSMEEAGYPGVLGVVSQGYAIHPEMQDLLSRLILNGWEIALHTDTHRNLGLMETQTPALLSREIRINQQKVTAWLGVSPITLILPEGQMVQNAEFLSDLGIVWAVGIIGGTRYHAASHPIYVGREGPDGDAQTTFDIMMTRFDCHPE